jgi:hypothetical protein
MVVLEQEENVKKITMIHDWLFGFKKSGRRRLSGFWLMQFND